MRQFALAFSCVLTFLSCNAVASTAIIFVEKQQPAYSKKTADLGAQIALHHLKRRYQKVLLVTENLFQTLKKQNDVTDLVIIADESQSVLQESEVQKNKFEHLRTVYIFAKKSQTLASSWKKAGAIEAWGYEKLPQPAEFYLARLFRLVGQGESFVSAMVQAEDFAEQSFQILKPYLKTENQLDDLNQVGLTQSTDTKKIKKEESGFGAFLNSLMPTVSFQVESFPKLQSMIEQIKEISWEHLADLFPASENFFGTLPFTLEPGGPTAHAPEDVLVNPRDEIWIDGETLKFYLSAFIEKENTKDLIQSFSTFRGVRIIRRDHEIHLAVYFSGETHYRIKDVNEVKNLQLYGVDIPTVTRVSVSVKESQIFIKETTRGQFPLSLLVKIPYGPDHVYFHGAQLDVENWSMKVEAGVVGNAVTLIGQGKIETKKFTGGIDVLETFSSNKGLFRLMGIAFKAF